MNDGLSKGDHTRRGQGKGAFSYLKQQINNQQIPIQAINELQLLPIRI